MTGNEMPRAGKSSTASGDHPIVPCVDCRTPIPSDALKCPACQSYQHKARHLLSLAPSLSLLVAIIALMPATVKLISDALADKTPKYSVLSFFADNVASPKGVLADAVDFSINAQITNLGDERLIVDDSLTCRIRESVELSGGEMTSIGFSLYFENTQKAIIPALSTKTVTWGVTEEQTVELYLDSPLAADPQTKFSDRELKLFYKTILDSFSRAKSEQSEQAFPRGAYFIDGRLSSFFLNLDCDVELENSHSKTNEELHLEFVYEFSGSSGDFPRWGIGKNTGGGWGNGFGNGAGGQ